MMLSRLARLFGGNRARTRDVLGNAVIGDVNGILIQTTITGPPPEPLSLPWRELAPGSGTLDIFNLLTQRSRLSETLVGRDDDIDRLLSWARMDSRPIAIRLLTGPGGAGQSRLAAEVANTLRKGGLEHRPDRAGEVEHSSHCQGRPVRSHRLPGGLPRSGKGPATGCRAAGTSSGQDPPSADQPPTHALVAG